MSSASHRADTDFPALHDRRPLIDQFAADWGNVCWLIGRILIGGIFVQSGFEKLIHLDGFAASLAAKDIPAASTLAVMGALVEFIGGVSVVLGLATRYAALLMMAFVVAATLISHQFWEAPDAQQHAQAIQFAKNVAIFGGFLFVFVTGGGHFTLDRLWRPRSINMPS
jgi:putative oxidoreductase